MQSIKPSIALITATKYSAPQLCLLAVAPRQILLPRCAPLYGHAVLPQQVRHAVELLPVGQPRRQLAHRQIHHFPPMQRQQARSRSRPAQQLPGTRGLMRTHHLLAQRFSAAVYCFQTLETRAELTNRCLRYSPQSSHVC